MAATGDDLDLYAIHVGGRHREVAVRHVQPEVAVIARLEVAVQCAPLFGPGGRGGYATCCQDEQEGRDPPARLRSRSEHDSPPVDVTAGTAPERRGLQRR